MTVSRRNFLTRLGVASTLATFPAFGTAGKAVAGHQDKKLGVALVGLGSYATNQLLPALKQARNCYLAGIVTGTPAKAEKWKKDHNLPEGNIYNYDNFDTIADNPAIDVVYVVLPNSMHAEFSIRAAQAGKHVICEKPMAVSVTECDQMIAAAKKAGVRLFIGYRLHAEPFTQEAMRFRTTDVGAIKVVVSEMGFRIGDPKQWRLRKSLAGGGAMMDVGIYAIQGARYSTGEEPVAVWAQEFKTDPVKFREVDETITWQMEFPSGATSTSTTSYASSMERLFISAEKGWLELRPAFAYGPIKGKTHKGELNLPVVHHQTAQMEHFSACILEGKPSNEEGEEGKRDMKIIEAIYRSIETGKKVRLS